MAKLVWKQGAAGELPHSTPLLPDFQDFAPTVVQVRRLTGSTVALTGLRAPPGPRAAV